VKILLNRRPVEGPWGGGNHFVRSFYDVGMRQGHEIVSNFCPDLDAILMVDPRYDDLGISINEIVQYKAYKPSTFILHRINECDSRKGTNDVDGLLRECSRQSGASIFVSNWMKEYHLERGWKCGNNYVIHNGADLNHFHPREKLKNNKINIVTHHWSNNVLKGFDIYEAIDEFVGQNGDFTFTYIGRCRNTFKNTKVVPPLFGAALGEELSKYDIYISGSRFDPGPNHILESLACGIPTYVFKDGGGCVEFAGEDHVYSSFENLRTLLLSRNYSKNAFEVSSWEHCIDNFEKLMNEVLSR